MDAVAIVALLERLRCDKIRVKAKWVECSCPLAQWTHPKAGTDSRPSFGVSIEAGTVSRWRCHSCNRGGTLTELLWSLQRWRGESFAKELAEIRLHDGVGVAALDALKHRVSENVDALNKGTGPGWYTAPKPPTEIAQALAPLPESDLDDFFVPITIQGEAGRYLREKRRLYPATWGSWGLRWHPTARRIAIPIRDFQGRLMGITGRAVGDTKKRWLHSTGFRRDYVLFGEDHFVPEARTAIVVEGNFDTIYLWQQGYVGVAGVMGSYISPYQLQQFRKFFDKAIIFRDGDEPGKAAADRWFETLSPWMPTTLAMVENGRDPDEYSSDELRDILGPPSSGQPQLTTLD